jgi:surfeit locus 1 family protein
MTTVRRPTNAFHPVERRELLHPRWIIATLLVLIASGVMIRLGVWQLDRLEQRRSSNLQVKLGMSQPPLDLNAGIPSDLNAMEYRSAVVSGQYDFGQEILLRNQVSEGQTGYHILTPLLIEGSDQAVLVDRGFILLEEGNPGAKERYKQPGKVTIRGTIMRSQSEPRIAGVPDPELQPGQTRLDAWNFINLDRISQQVEPSLLNVYLLADPDLSLTNTPKRSVPEVDLSEGPHMGYAIQWFIFAGILLVGYPFYVRNQLRYRANRS